MVKDDMGQKMDHFKIIIIFLGEDKRSFIIGLVNYHSSDSE